MKYLYMFIVFLFGCSNLEKSTSNHNLDNSLKKFDVEFPPQEPTKNLIEPISGEQKVAIKNMIKSLHAHFLKSGVEHKVIGNQIIILPSQKSELNQLGMSLDGNSISLMYDATYFAKNPFSAGTFNAKERKFLLSQILFNDPIKLKRVVNHELVHVETYKKFGRKEFSPFYCKFTGNQFAPHYLSCDEMNAYSVDLKNLKAEKADQTEIDKKINHTKMHTQPIKELISGLDYDSIKLENNTVKITGRNLKGSYQMEFPAFLIEMTRNLRSSVKRYSDKVKMTANKIEADLLN